MGAQVPYFNAPIYLANKASIGKVDEILGPINEVYFTIKMAEGMVAQLEARLHAEPKNLDGWVMLMRSRMTLGEPAKAKAALEAAVKANPGEAAELRRQAQALGIS